MRPLVWAVLLSLVKNSLDSTTKARDLTAQSCSSSAAWCILATKTVRRPASTLSGRFFPESTAAKESHWCPAPLTLKSDNLGRFNIQSGPCLEVAERNGVPPRRRDRACGLVSEPPGPCKPEWVSEGKPLPCAAPLSEWIVTLSFSSREKCDAERRADISYGNQEMANTDDSDDKMLVDSTKKIYWRALTRTLHLDR